MKLIDVIFSFAYLAAVLLISGAVLGTGVGALVAAATWVYRALT